MVQPIFLGVNIDHVATVRQARGSRYPDPVYAALVSEIAGADGITMHLREDRRHIQDRDVDLVAQTLQTRLNLEMAITPEMLKIAERIKPTYCCLVPEKRAELTTEGGLDVVAHRDEVADAVVRLCESGIQPSLFIDPDDAQIEAAHACNAPVIELHTGTYAEAKSHGESIRELHRIENAAKKAHEMGLVVNAGHGLHYHNVQPIAAIECLYELNIGHAIVARAVFEGLAAAVKEMKRLMVEARSTL